MITETTTTIMMMMKVLAMIVTLTKGRVIDHNVSNCTFYVKTHHLANLSASILLEETFNPLKPPKTAKNI